MNRHFSRHTKSHGIHEKEKKMFSNVTQGNEKYGQNGKSSSHCQKKVRACKEVK